MFQSPVNTSEEERVEKALVCLVCFWSRYQDPEESSRLVPTTHLTLSQEPNRDAQEETPKDEYIWTSVTL